MFLFFNLKCLHDLLSWRIWKSAVFRTYAKYSSNLWDIFRISVRVVSILVSRKAPVWVAWPRSIDCLTKLNAIGVTALVWQIDCHVVRVIPHAPHLPRAYPCPVLPCPRNCLSPSFSRGPLLPFSLRDIPTSYKFTRLHTGGTALLPSAYRRTPFGDSECV